MTLRTLVAHPLERSCPDHVRPAQLGGQGRAVGLFYCTPLSLEIQVVVERHLSQLEFGMALCNASGAEFASPLSRDVMAPSALEPGEYVFELALPTLKLSTGSYYLDLGVRSDRGMEDHIVQAIHFEVLPNAESAEAMIHHRRGHVIPEISFSMRKLQTRRDIHSGTAVVPG